jgi:predicted DNA-binding transcriptional regulator AlpA
MRLLNKRQTAERVGCHPEHLMRMARQRQFPQPIKLTDDVNSAVRWDEDEIEQWYEQRKAARRVWALVESEPVGLGDED